MDSYFHQLPLFGFVILEYRPTRATAPLFEWKTAPANIRLTLYLCLVYSAAVPTAWYTSQLDSEPLDLAASQCFVFFYN